MQHTKLISILRSFSQAELKSFEKFISFPHHSGWRNALPLFIEIKKHYPGFDDRELTREKLYEKVYPGKPYDDSRMRKQMSYLYKVAEDFLVIQELGEREAERSLLLMNQLRKRELSNLFEAESRRTDKEISPEKYELQDYYTDRIRYEYMMFTYYYNSENNLKKAFPYLGFQLEEAALLFGLILVNTLRDRNMIEENFSPEYHLNVPAAYEKLFDIDGFIGMKKQSESGTLLRIDYHIWKAEMTGKVEEYNKAKALLIENITGLSKATRYKYFTDLQSLNTGFKKDRKNEGGVAEIWREAFELAKLQSRYDAVTSEDGEPIEVDYFKRILNTALVLKEFEWAEEFIETYSGKLGAPHRLNMKNYAYALVNYLKGNFERSLEYLILVKPSSPFLKFDVRELNFSLFYELGLYEEARYLITTSQKYYSGTKELSPVVKEAGVNFLKYYKELVKLTDKIDKSEIEMQLSKLKKEQNITSKIWLTGKFESLLK